MFGLTSGINYSDGFSVFLLLERVQKESGSIRNEFDVKQPDVYPKARLAPKMVD
jgi:hypothetical protein